MTRDLQSKDFLEGSYKLGEYKWGRLSLTAVYREGRYKFGKFICDCGNNHSARLSSVLCGDSKSCGCLAKELVSERSSTHGLSGHRLFSVWYGMIKRCLRRKSKDYHHYGGRGITICNRWHPDNPKGLENFIEDMDNTYIKGLELERKDVNGDYTPDNCTWVSRRAQTNNLRCNVTLMYEGVEMGVSEWAYLLGVDSKVLHDRRRKLGWDDDVVLFEPYKKRTTTIHYKGKKYGVLSFVKTIGISFSKYLRERNNDPVNWVEKYGAIMEDPYTRPDPDKVVKFIRTGVGFCGDTYAQEIFLKYKDKYND